MSKKYRLTSQAIDDISQIVDYIAEHSPQNALTIFDEMHAAMQKLAEMPGG
jgi:plasmid stabilization system protein ParE